MCEFFSFNTNGQGKYFYFTPKNIKKIKKEDNPKQYDFSSHTSIADYYGADEDNQNKYEYNPFSLEFKVDQINNDADDRIQAGKWVKNLFKFKNRKDFLDFCNLYRSNIDYNKMKKELNGIPTSNNVLKLLKRVENIDWFKPQKIVQSKVQLKVNTILNAVNLDFKEEAEIKKLKYAEDWDAAWSAAWDAARSAAWDTARSTARSAARDAAWSAARDAARGAAWDATRDAARGVEFELVKDLMKKKGYKTNPFEKLLQLWEMGLYPYGIIKNKKFLIYYVPLGDRCD